MMGQVAFIVARESVEALLVVGILYAWLNAHESARAGKRWLFAGVLAGVVLAALLALTLIGVTTFLGGEARDSFEIAMLLVAAALIVQMVFWMHEHGRTMKRDLENHLQQNMASNNWWGVLVLAALATGREGSETVVFLYGSFLQLASTSGYVAFAASTAAGLCIALALFALLQLGSRLISWKWFFRITEWMLLLLGSNLFLTAMGKMLTLKLHSVELPAWLYSSVWDTSSILPDSSVAGNLLSSLIAYRSQPAGWDLLMLGFYWLSIYLLFRWRARAPASRHPATA